MTIHQLINRKKSWTQKADARDKDGRPVNISCVDYFRPPSLKNIQSFSLYGAVVFLYSQEKHSESRQKVMASLRKAISKYTGKDLAVAEFNDDPQTTFEDISKVLQMIKK